MDLRAIGMGLAFAFMWSSAFTSAHVIVAAAPPLYALALRFLVSGLIAVGLAAAAGQSPRMGREQWRATALFGICQNVLYLGLNFIAMQRVDASLAAIIASTMPLLVALAGWLFLGERIRPLGIAGLFGGLAGVGIIMGSRLTGGVDVPGLIYCVLGVIALAFATLSVRRASAGGNLLMIVGLQMLIGAGVLAVLAALTETPTIHWSWRLVLAFAYTTLIPGLLATWVWFRLVGRIGAIRASTFHFLNPFLGVTIAAALLGERLGPADLLGVAIIALGILAVQVAKQQGAGRPPATARGGAAGTIGRGPGGGATH